MCLIVCVLVLQHHASLILADICDHNHWQGDFYHLSSVVVQKSRRTFSLSKGVSKNEVICWFTDLEIELP
jgi:hypothetical protein